VRTPFALGSRRIPHYRLPLHTPPRRTSNLSLSCTRRIPFCYATPEHTLRSSFSRYPPTPGSRFMSHTHSRSLTVVISVGSTVVLRQCLKFGLVGRGGGVCSSCDVGPGPGLHHSQCLAFDTPVLEFEVYPKRVSITSPAPDFGDAGAVEVGLIFGLVEKDVAGMAFGYRQRMNVSQEQ